MAAEAPSLDAVLEELREHYVEEDIMATSCVTDISPMRNFGGFATIHTATWTPKVAVKFIKTDQLPDPGDLPGRKILARQLKRLRQEVSVWRRLQHENIQNLRGVHWPRDNLLPAMISDWEEEGNLDNRLVKLTGLLSGQQLELEAEKLNLLEGVLLGLAYLHSMKVIHADLKSENVLISPRGKPLLCDFGISWASVKISVTFTRDRQSGPGTPRWMAPELMDEPTPGELGYSFGSDTWAVGCLISRVLGNEHPFSNKETNHTVIAALIRGEFFPRPPLMLGKEYDSYWAFVYWCCTSTPDSRPSAIAVLSQLQLLRFLHSPDLPTWAQDMRENYFKALKRNLSKAQRRGRDSPAYTAADELKSKRYRQNIATAMARTMETVKKALRDRCDEQQLWKLRAYDVPDGFKTCLSGFRRRLGTFPMCILDSPHNDPEPSDKLWYARLELNDTTFMGCWHIDAEK